MGFELGPNRYGKAGIHLATVVRGEERHEFSEREIEVRLEGDFEEVHTEGDNATVLPTDTMRSSAFALAFEHPAEPLESFALRYTGYLLDASPAASRAEAWMTERPWERVVIDGQPHPHAFTRGAFRWTTHVVRDRDEVRLSGGVDELYLLKTTGSAFSGFLRDRYTILPETEDRILATELDARWRYARPKLDFAMERAACRDALVRAFAHHDDSRSVQHTLWYRVLRDPERRPGLRRDRQAFGSDRGDGAADRGRRLGVSRSFPDDGWRDLLERAHRAAAEHRRRFPGDLGAGQPLETLYVSADRVTATTTVEFGAEALRLLDAHTPDSGAFEVAFGVDAAVAERTRARVRAKLERAPVEDLRVDFEDGYGTRPDDEEDRHAEEAARAVQASRADGTAPPSFGLRVKSFADGAEARSLRTLDTFLTSLTEAAGELPDGFVVTLPKVETPEHVAIFAEALERLEIGLGLAERALRFEVQVETPRSVLGPDGSVAAGSILDAAGGRLAALHFGVFDYTASLRLMPWEQRLDHPANDFARHALQVALAGTGVRISDGSSNVAPASDRTDDVHAAWRVHADLVRHSLSDGFVQGWDLHPAQLASRYAAVYGWLLAHLDDATSRVRAWREGVAAAGVLDEPATVTSLLRYLRFAVSSGAVDEAEVLDTTGLARDELLGERRGG